MRFLNYFIKLFSFKIASKKVSLVSDRKLVTISPTIYLQSQYFYLSVTYSFTTSSSKLLLSLSSRIKRYFILHDILTNIVLKVSSPALNAGGDTVKTIFVSIYGVHKWVIYQKQLQVANLREFFHFYILADLTDFILLKEFSEGTTLAQILFDCQSNLMWRGEGGEIIFSVVYLCIITLDRPSLVNR